MPPEPPPAVADFGRLLEAARRGDPASLPALRFLLDQHPAVWRHAGDLAAHAERAWVELAAGSDLPAREALTRQLVELKAELAGPAPTPLERLLVARIAATWLQVNYADAVAAQARDVSVKQAELALERQDRAHRRHLAAVAALATVRRLLPAATSTNPGSPTAAGPPPLTLVADRRDDRRRSPVEDPEGSRRRRPAL